MLTAGQIITFSCAARDGRRGRASDVLAWIRFAEEVLA